MDDGSPLRPLRDGLITVLVVLLSFFVIGRIGGSIPHGWTASLVSGGLYVAVLVAYGRYAGPGRRSGPAPFLIGTLLLWPALSLWVFRQSAETPGMVAAFLFGELQVGGSVRPCPHTGDFCLIVWWLFSFVMIGAVLFIRGMLPDRDAP